MEVSVMEFGNRVGRFLVKHVAPAIGDSFMQIGIGFIANSMLVPNLLNHPMAGLLGVVNEKGKVDLQVMHKCAMGAFDGGHVLDLTRFGVAGKGLTREDVELFFENYCPIDTADAGEK